MCLRLRVVIANLSCPLEESVETRELTIYLPIPHTVLGIRKGVSCLAEAQVHVLLIRCGPSGDESFVFGVCKQTGIGISNTLGEELRLGVAGNANHHRIKDCRIESRHRLERLVSNAP